MPDALLVLVLVTAVGAGLAAGVFFAFSNFVMAALGRIPAAEGIRAMQEINVTVINPLFMAVLFGTGLLSLAVIVAALVDWDGAYSPFLVGAGVAYVIGTVVVTMAFNVPRNNEVARQDPDSTAAEEVWGRYLREWTAWNTVRTVASLAALGLFIGAIVAG